MIALLTALVLSQTVTPVKIVNPENQSQGLGNANPLKVNCVSGCSGSSGGGGTGDGGYTIVIQGPGADGGVDWGVTVTGTVGISGSVAVTGPLTDTQLRASAVPVSAAALPLPAGAATGTKQDTANTSLANLDVALSTRTKPADQQHVIVDSSASIGVTGPLTDTQLRASVVPVYVDGGTILATQGTSPWVVSGTVTTTPPSNATTNVAQFGGSNVVTGTGTGGAGIPRVTVSSDSTVTANAGTNLNTSALALDATLTGRTAKAQVTDGTRDGTVKAASTPAAAADTSLVIALSPNSPVPTGSNVIGHVIADTGSTTAVTGNVTAVQGTGTNLHVVSDATSTTAVTQATGTNLHAVLDTTSTTAVTQATGTNLHAVIDTGSTTAVTGNVTVVQGTGTNLHAVLDTTSTTAVTQATASSLNAQVQGAGASGAAKAGNPVQVGGVFNATAPTITTGQGVEAQADQAGNLRTFAGTALTTLSAWTSATALNTTQNIFTNSGATAALVHLVQTTTVTGGAITFEVTYDNANWVTIPADAVLDPSSTSFAQIALPYTLVASTNKPFLLTGKGWQGLRIKLSTAITGTATVTPNYALLNDSPARTVLALSPTAANFNVTTVPPANASTNVAQFGGSNVVTGAGASGAGIPRVTISNDSSLAANQSVNVAQINGTTPLMGVGASGTGAQRVAALLHDGTTTVGVIAGTTALKTDLSSVAGTATATGNGTAATSIRVSVASDSTGTIAATESGTWTVQPGNTANTTPWLTTDTPRTVSSTNNTGTCVSVSTSTTVLASNASRRTYFFKASEANTDLVYCKLGATATSSNVPFDRGAGFGQDTGAVYTGVIDCIAASGTQSVCPYEMN